MKKYNKRGISLIVLVITIIVMIILAAAIILSISNSGIMDKANQAKTESDTANLKEYANVLEAEWELMTADERSSSGYASKEAYVNGKLADKYPNAALGADGEVYTGLNEAARKAIAGGIKIGEIIKYEVATKTVTSEKANNGYGKQDVIAETNLTWRYIGISDKGEILISPDITTSLSKFQLTDKEGYLNGPDELDRLCRELYDSDKGTARSMNIDDVLSILEYSGTKGSYVDTSGVSQTISEPQTIGEIQEQTGFPMFVTGSPDNRAYTEFVVDAYTISSSNKLITKDSEKTELIYQSGAYWLASSCVSVNFNGHFIGYGLRYVAENQVTYFPYYSNSNNVQYNIIDCDSSGQCTYRLMTIRPVVALNSNVQITKAADGNWSI